MSRTQPLPRLDAAAISHTLELSADPAAAIDDLSIPAAPGVVIFEAADGSTVLIATTADARALVRKRLGLVAPEAGTSPAKTWRVDYRALTARVLVIRVGSSLEADAVYLAQARTRLPHAYKIVTERWRAWFVHVDPNAEFPEWTKTNLLGLVGTRSASTLKQAPRRSPSVGEGPRAEGPVADALGSQCPGVLLGPMPDKDSAGRFIEAMIDAFDLCRFHHLLVQAPRASACAYKEMGRCPAPCDGTETMDAYRRRTREAIETVATGGVQGTIAELESRMRDAAQGQDFENAHALKTQTERLSVLTNRAFAQVNRLDRWDRVLVLPSPVKKLVRIGLFTRGRLLHVGDADPANLSELGSLADIARRSILEHPVEIDGLAINTIAIFTRWLFLAANKRRGQVCAIDSTNETLSKAARAVGKIDPVGTAFEDQQIEGG